MGTFVAKLPKDLFGALFLLTATGCGEDGHTCGPGTVARGRVCVALDAGQDATPDAAADAAADAALPGEDAAVVPDAEVPLDAASPLPVGCQDGMLVDIRSYFYSVIGRTEGELAPDWVAVLDASGIPNGPGPGEVLPADAPFYGLTQQRGTLGDVRGRIMLPTTDPDALDYYTHPIDVLVGEPLAWGWNDWLGGPPYAPRPCP